MRDAIKILTTAFVSMCVGCAMCESSMDGDFHAYGGSRDRIDRVNGRVGSLFDPAAAVEAVPFVEQTLPPVDTPAGTDGATTRRDDGSVEDSGVTEDLLEDLKQFGELPPVPGVESDSGGDDADSSNGLDFDDI